MERRPEQARKIGTFGRGGLTRFLSNKVTRLAPRAEIADAQRRRGSEVVQGQGVRKRCSLVGVKMPASLYRLSDLKLGAGSYGQCAEHWLP
jgi:hypothetical protein